MAIDKSLNQAPLGLDASFAAGAVPGVNMPVPDEEVEIEIEIELPEDADQDEPEDETEDEEFNENLAEVLEDSELAELAGDLLGDFDDDVSSRKDWIQTYVDGLELLGMNVEDRDEPWPGACGVFHPLLAESVVKFQAETMMETFPAQGPVRTQIIGKETPAKRDAAARVQDDMNYQLTERMVEYRPEHERMLWGLGLAGNAFKKVYFDPSLDRQVSMYVSADDVVVPYGASNLETAERVTHVMRKTENEMRRLQRDGFYRDVDLPEPTFQMDEIEKKIAEKLGFKATNDDRYKLLEMQVDLIIEEDKFRDDDDEGVALPYIITIDKSSQEVLAIRRNWQPDDKLKAKRNHFVHYAYVPGFGFYAFGLIHLIGAFAKSGTSIIRQLVDAGTLSNLPGGFKTKGLRVKGDDTPIAPAEFRDVDVASGTMRDNIMPLPYKEPSQVLYQLLQTIVEEGRRFAGMADLQVSDMSGQAPVGTTLAILERSLKMMSAVQARVHYAMKQEFKLLKHIIAEYTPETYSYEPEEGDRKAKKSDYDNVDVLPVSDPNAATMAQKIVQYQAVIQLAQSAPQIYDMPYLHRQMLEVLGIKNAAKLVPLEDDENRKPRDPVSENMDMLNGKPVKAFIYQDHEAHIVVHTSMAQDPKVQQMVGQSPNAQSIMAAGAAHLQEHLAFAYRKQIEEMAGVPLPPPGSDMDEDTELQVSRLAAMAAQKLLQKDQSEAAQQQAQQAQQDPIVQMQMKELEIKAKEVELKEKKLMIDAAEKNDKIELEQSRIAAQKEIAGLQVGAKIATDKVNLSAKQQEAGLRIGVEIAREAMQSEQTPAAPNGGPANEEGGQ
jgi:hypothetical protein